MTHTPWGRADESTPIAPGITQYSTPRHGGIRVTPRRQAQMPDYLRLGDADKVGWYEEDCEWARVACAFPEFFDDKAREQALETLKNYFPKEYERHTGKTLARGESRARDSALFLEDHRDDFLVAAAYGSWHEGVPEGYVGVFAVRGGWKFYDQPAADGPESRYFLVPKDEYNARGALPFVVDPSRHTRCLYRDGRFIPIAPDADLENEETEGSAPR